MPFIDVPEGAGDNLERLFALRPEVYAAWRELVTAVKATSDERRYELATLAAARRLRSSYCSLAHGKVLAEQFYDFASVPLLPEGLEDVDRAIMAFAEKVVADATAVTQGTSRSCAGSASATTRSSTSSSLRRSAASSRRRWTRSACSPTPSSRSSTRRSARR